MSKRIVRISVSLLVALVLLTGIYTVVYGAAAVAETSHGSMAYIANSSRTTRPSLNVFYSDLQRPAKVHDCDFDSGYNTSDD